MKRNKNYRFQSHKKGKGKVLTISLLISGIIMTSLVTWVGFNGWDVEKSIDKLGTTIGIIKKDKEKALEVDETQEVDEEPASQNSSEKENEIEEENVLEQEPPITKDKTNYIKGQKLPTTPTFVKEVLIVNKQYPLPETYKPGENREARLAFDNMAAEALLDGFNLHAFSTYRSFDRQTELYERYVERDGIEEADRYSARPGYSEHQTGLAFDIGEVNGEKDWASSRFGETAAGEWIATNAHRFGFIMRYPEGKEEVTGYMHESWHYRYVGPEIAEEIYKGKITLEEYLGI